MEGRKLQGRVENVIWDPPFLSFTLERHGGTVLGSSRAEVHRWTLDVEQKTATCAVEGYRQVRPQSPRMDVTAEAEAVFQLMCDHQDDDCLKWSEDGSVRVQIGKIVPRSGPQQTVANRRKRLRNALDNLVEEAGGQVLGPNRYRLREQP